MLIGLTYDLRSEYLAEGMDEDETAEFDSEYTINAIEEALRAFGHDTERIGNARKLIAAVVAGRRWDMVFNIAEGLNGIGREAQVPAILDLFSIPYTFSDPMVLSLTLNKAMTKRVIRDAGLPTTPFIEVAPGDDIVDVPFEPPYFVKPVAEGTGKGVSMRSIVTRGEDLEAVCSQLMQRYRQPVLVEQYLPGREFTVGIVGTGRQAEVIGTVEVILKAEAEQGAYSYVNKARFQELVEYRLVDPLTEPLGNEVEALALRAYRVLGCRDAGRVDIRCDGQELPHFIEINPLAGIHPEHSDLPIICSRRGIAYNSLIERIMASALGRAG
ncbi:MAG TPA: ATP-grasp domain-containing protein [Desulfobacteraceae bacterium]|nr:ATP-grasp domain-containing protein [Desulfobacteraceae bacterium]